jgi:RNA-binding protein
MLTGKQRSYLRSKANTLDPMFQLGKNGLTENFIKQVDVVLESKELLKISVLNNSGLDAKEVCLELADSLNAEFVQSMGNKLVIYRESKEDKKIQLP